MDEHDKDDELSRLIRRDGTHHRASDDLRAKVRTQIALAEAGRSDAPGRPRWRWFPRLSQGMSWASLGAGFAAGLLAAWLAGPWWPVAAPSDPLAAELVALHVHALRDGPLIQVVSTDRHTVKPWFQGKLDYAPPVFDLADDGFVLQGGRVEQLHGARTAVLVYKRREHVINLFVWPAEREQASRPDVRRGFQVLTWADAAMQYGAVSDVERAELERFMQLWRERATR